MANGTKIKCIARSKGYTIVDNILLLDRRLTPKARLIGIFMLKMRNEWDYNINGLVKTIGCIGKASLRAALHELEEFGYLQRFKKRGGKGLFNGYDYLLIENPEEYAKESNSKVSEINDELQPSSENRTTDNRTQVIIDPSNYQSYPINNNNNVAVTCQKLKLNIHASLIAKLVDGYGLEQVTNGLQFGIITMPKPSTNPEGYIIYSIQNNFSLTAEEQEQLRKAAEEFQKQKEKELNTRIIEFEEAGKTEAERSTTCAWWDHLSIESKEHYWKRIMANINPFLRPKIPAEHPATLGEINVVFRYSVINELIKLRKEDE